MKKILIMFILVFVLCGCSVEYNLDIHNDTIKEDFKIVETSTSLFDSNISEFFTMRQYFEKLVAPDPFVYDDSEKKLIDDGKSLGIKYKNKITNYSDSEVFNQCYDDIKFTKEDKVVSIDTGNNFNCYKYYNNIESIKVTIKTNNKVLSNNADYIDGKKYVWNITENGNKRILFSYVEKEKLNIPYWPFVLILLLIIIWILYNYFKQKVENSNNI